MLAEQNIENRASAPDLTYSDLLDLVVERREAVLAFDNYLRRETAWLQAPASTRFHLAKPGGLVEHSVNVARTLLKLRDLLAPDIPTESCVIVALYHDLGKAGSPGKAHYLKNDAHDWRSARYPYFVNQELVHLDHATRSLFLLARYVPLSDEEAQAIRYHDGQYLDDNRSVANKEVRLTRLLQYADSWSGLEVEAG